VKQLAKVTNFLHHWLVFKQEPVRPILLQLSKFTKYCHLYWNGFKVAFYLIFRFQGNNPIFVQLEYDPSVPKRFIEIIFSSQVVMSGVNVQTPEKMGLRSFSVSYTGLSLQYSSPLVYTQIVNVKGNPLVG